MQQDYDVSRACVIT